PFLGPIDSSTDQEGGRKTSTGVRRRECLPLADEVHPTEQEPANQRGTSLPTARQSGPSAGQADSVQSLQHAAVLTLPGDGHRPRPGSQISTVVDSPLTAHHTPIVRWPVSIVDHHSASLSVRSFCVIRLRSDVAANHLLLPYHTRKSDFILLDHCTLQSSVQASFRGVTGVPTP